jgi:pSer/pThr/pTyr-binding forkhead associated (FHA) protein
MTMSLPREKETEFSKNGALAGDGYHLWQGPSPTVAPTPRLLINTQIFQNCVALTSGGKWNIGRDMDNTIVLPDNLVSRRHAILQCLPSGQFSFRDLGSLNGSYVNNRRVSDSVVLTNSDRILLGETEIEFQFPDHGAWRETLSPPAKTVLMIQSSKMQGEIWREILTSQGLSTIWTPSRMDVTRVLDQMQSLGLSIPELLLLDIGTQKNNPYDFCRTCREAYPQLQVLLVSNVRSEICAAERKWALLQGALDLFPGFQKPNIFTDMTEVVDRVRIILDVLNWTPVAKNSLSAALLSLQEEADEGEVNFDQQLLAN